MFSFIVLSEGAAVGSASFQQCDISKLRVKRISTQCEVGDYKGLQYIIN